MAGVAFFYGSTFFCLLLMSYAAFFSPSAGFYHFIEADKMVILDFLSKIAFRSLARVYARARFNDNNNIIDIDIRYRYMVVLACFKLF